MPSFCYLFHSLASHVHSIPFLFLLLYLPLLSFLLFAAVIFLPCPFRAFPNLLIGTERREDCPRQRPEEAKVGSEWRGCEETNGQNSRHRERRDGGNGMTWRRGKRGEGKIWPPPSLLYSPLPSLIIPSLQRVRERGDEWTVRKWTVTTEGRDRCVWPLCASIPLFAAIRTERSEGWGRWPDGRERRWESGEWSSFPFLLFVSPLLSLSHVRILPIDDEGGYDRERSGKRPDMPFLSFPVSLYHRSPGNEWMEKEMIKRGKE